MTKYCECGREIRVSIHGSWGPPPDNDHNMCQQCWRSTLDSSRHI
jgi:hypothetical protein